PAIYPQGGSESLPVLQRMPGFIDKLSGRLQAAVDSTEDGEANSLYRQLLALLPDARSRVARLIEDLRKIADQASGLADGMDFGFLVNRNRQLLSIGLDVETERLNSACYDLLASEARIATFIAIANDDI